MNEEERKLLSAQYRDHITPMSNEQLIMVALSCILVDMQANLEVADGIFVKTLAYELDVRGRGLKRQ